MKHAVLLTSLLIYMTLACQESALWETQIYFEDGVGNRDTITIGRDTSASFTMLNPQFGEEDISHLPYDSVFEARASQYNFYMDAQGADGDPPEYVQSKKIVSYIHDNGYIHYPEGDCYFRGTPIYLSWYSKYGDVTISWDQEVFSSEHCVLGTLIATHFAHLWVSDEFWASTPHWAERTRCLASDPYYEVESDILLNDYGLYTVDYVEGSSGLDSIRGAVITFPHPVFTESNSVCPVGLEAQPTSSIAEHDDIALFVFPNPAGKELGLSSMFPMYSYAIYDLQGNIVQIERNFSDGKIDIAHLPKGLYLLSIIHPDSATRVSKRFVKN